jgi:ribonuclease P protein component
VNGGEQEQSGTASSFRFPHAARLLKHAGFELVYREGRRIFSANLTVFFRRRGEGEPNGGPRVGFTVGRALGGAVQRNRIKRRLRESVRHRLALLTGPVDVVINPKRGVLTAEFTQLLGEMERAFSQIRGGGAGSSEPRPRDRQPRTRRP